MSITYVVRHGRTELSARYIANGDVRTYVRLDTTGIAQCQRLARARWVQKIATCVISEFVRTAETAKLLLGDHQPDLVVDTRLNEMNYGRFEGQPWMAYGAWLQLAGPDAVPHGGESRNNAISRMIAGLTDCLPRPGPRLVVGHGLMVSAVLQLLRDQPLTVPDLPEAPYVAPIPLTDERLRDLLQRAGHAKQTRTPRSSPLSCITLNGRYPSGWR